jgi:hypothetical protein
MHLHKTVEIKVCVSSRTVMRQVNPILKSSVSLGTWVLLTDIPWEKDMKCVFFQMFYFIY